MRGWLCKLIGGFTSFLRHAYPISEAASYALSTLVYARAEVGVQLPEDALLQANL
jgi:hypothetical protein